MKTGKNIDIPSVDPEAEKRWQLSRRDDLASVIGVALTVPYHGQDQASAWRYGLRPLGGMGNQEIIDEFEREMRRIIIESVPPLVTAGILSEQQAEAIQSHGYETGPAAQSWPQFFFEVYQQAEPIISGSASLIAIADFIKQVAIGLRDWRERKREDLARNYEELRDRTIHVDLDPQIVLTLPNLVALCYTDLVQRHGEVGNVAITVFPRNRWGGYGSADHPSGGETYLVRLTTEDASYFYLVDGGGGVSEHYRTVGADLELLALPDLLPDDTSGNPYRQPEQPRQFEVRVSTSVNKPL
jgi:hypothetical protein